MSVDVTPLLFDGKNPVPPLEDNSEKTARQVIGTEVLSYAQQRLWFLARLEPESPLYNVPSALRLQGSLNVEALAGSLTAIVERHEILRTNYGIKEGTPVQLIKSAAPLSLEPMDVATAGDREMVLATLLEREASRPFDLAAEPVIRVRLFRLAAEDHVLFFDIHHIACDEWSMAILFQELAELYGKFSRGEQPALEEPAIQYADFACWQREWIQQGGVQASLSYWKQKLQGALPVLELPADRMYPMATRHAGQRAQQSLDADLTGALRSLARKEGVTSFILLLTAFKALLYRYTGQSDLIVGTPISGRNKVETEKLIGFFVNMLALRTEFSGELTFHQALARVRETVLGGFAHQEVPFDTLVEELRPDRSAGHNPFFNTIFALHTEPQKLTIPGLTTRPLEVYNHTSKFDVNLTVEDAGAEMRLVVEYNTEIFEPRRIERLLQHFHELLKGIVADPAQPIAQLPLLTAGERNQIISEWNQTATPFPSDDCVHFLFERQAAASPSTRALEFPEATLTYDALNTRANQLAHYLRRLGLQPGTPVGICVERSAEMIVGILGILKAGGAYLPLDTTYPSERLRFMAKDAATPWVIVQRKALSNGQFDCDTICLETDAVRIDQESRANPENRNRALDPAYVIYTSGSTGIPKGICIPHRAINRLVFNTNYMQFSPAERIAQISNASFDAATFEIWGSLLLGGQLVGFSKDTILSPAALVAALREQKITSLFLTVALFNQVSAEIPDAFSSVRSLLVGGDALDPVSIRRVLEHGRPKRLLNGYGPTECTTFAMWHQIDTVAETATNIPIGRPLSNTEAFILDAHRQPVPVGVPGELYLGGPGLALGYLNRPELTAEKFVAHPFNPDPDARLYRTGDLARYRDDGVVEFLGRTDHQVKLRGFRIELGEIESVLSRQAGVRETTVIIRQDTPGDKRLVAYLTVASENFSVADLREQMKKYLPDYMIPSAFVVLPKMPLTPNGKVDRRALPAPAETRVDAQRSLPRNNIELQLVKLWEKVLRVQPVGIFDNFFELGGHSLLAVRLFAEIEKTFGMAVGISTLFQAPTIQALARVISSGNYKAPGSCVVEVQPKGSRLPIFWLHTLGGGGGSGLFTYRSLAELLGSDQPSYGLVAPATPYPTIEEMAAHYVRELKTYQPNGPYQLGGYCFGGVVSYEMARQLLEKGEKVSFLGLIDSLAPNMPEDFNPAKVGHLVHLGSHLVHWGRALTHRSSNDWQIMAKKYANAFRQALRLGRPAPAVQLNDVIDTSNYPSDFKHNAEVHWQAVLNYRPKPYPGKMILFRARYRSLSGISPTLRWGKLVRDLSVVHVSAPHDRILDLPNVTELAEAMKNYLHPGAADEPPRKEPQTLPKVA